jgi:hypothetical protein
VLIVNDHDMRVIPGRGATHRRREAPTVLVVREERFDILIRAEGELTTPVVLSARGTAEELGYADEPIYRSATCGGSTRY